MSSLPPTGTPIVVTATRDGQVGKFFGTYDGDDEFILGPFPGKYHIFQLPMYKNQGQGWQYSYPPKKKEGVDPNQELVELYGVTHMRFPGDRDDPFTWTLMEEDPYMRVHDNLPEDIRMEISRILQTDGDRRIQLGKLATAHPQYKDNILKVARSESKLREILGNSLSAYGKVKDLKHLRVTVPQFKEHIDKSISMLEPIASVTTSRDMDSHSKIKRLSAIADPTNQETIKGEIKMLKNQPTPAIQAEMNSIVMGGRHADPDIRRLMIFHLANADPVHRLFSPGIMRELDSSKIVEDLGKQAGEIAAIFESSDIATVLDQLKSVADKYPQHKAKIDSLMHASILDEIDYEDRKSKDDASTKVEKLNNLELALYRFPEFADHKALLHRRVDEQLRRSSTSQGFLPPPRLTRSTNIGGRRRKTRRRR